MIGEVGKVCECGYNLPGGDRECPYCNGFRRAMDHIKVDRALTDLRIASASIANRLHETEVELINARETIRKQADIATQYRSMVVKYCESSRLSPMLEKLRTVDQEREKLHAKVHNSC